MPFTFACADFTFPVLEHSKVLDLLRLLDFEAVDLGIFEGRSHHYPSTVARDPEGSAEALRQRLDERGLAVSDVFVQTGPEPPVAAANTPDASVGRGNRETFDAMLPFAVGLGADHVTGLPGVRHEGVDAQTDWDRSVDEARRRVEACRQAGLAYAVEAHGGSITPDPDAARRFVEAVPGLTLTFDPGHFVYQGHDQTAALELLPFASHVHARGGAPGALQTPVRDNAIDFREIARRLRELDYAGRICLEYVYVDWEGCNRTDNVSETLLLRQELMSG